MFKFDLQAALLGGILGWMIGVTAAVIIGVIWP